MNLKHLLGNVSNLEDKYVFTISLGFWRLLVGLAGVALALGLLFFVWGLTPSFKPGVDKQAYPPPVEVSLQELQKKVLPPPLLASKESMPAPTDIQPAGEEEQQKSAEPATMPEEIAYNRLLDSLRTLIPPEKYAWESRGHWDYPYGRRYWEYYRTSQYRKWKVEYVGVKDRLEAAYQQANAETFADKQELLRAYLMVVGRFPEENRPEVLAALCTYAKESVPQSVGNVQLLNVAVDSFSTATTEYLKKLANFGKKNPNDGRAFIEYANAVLGKFDAEIRLDALQAMVAQYYRRFNNRIDLQKEITDSFLPLLAEFEPRYQVAALENYYGLYLRKNAERLAEIERIDEAYARERSRAESVLYEKKARKAEWRLRGVYAIGGAVVFIAFLALILALLSMRSYLQRICASLEAGR